MVLVVAAAFVNEQKAEHGENADIDNGNFYYSLGEDVEVIVSHPPGPLTWGRLSDILRGLQTYEIAGKRYKECYFEARLTVHFETHIAWGYVRKSVEGTRSLGTGALSLETSSSVSRRALPIFPSTVSSDVAIFRIPRSDIILTLHTKGDVSPQAVEAVLITADAWVARKISIFGDHGPTDFIFNYSTGERPIIRLVIYNTLVGSPMCWGQLKTVIDGLWIYLVEESKSEDTYWEIYEGHINQESLIGYGTIMTQFDSSNSTSKRSLPLAPSPSPVSKDLTNALST